LSTARWLLASLVAGAYTTLAYSLLVEPAPLFVTLGLFTGIVVVVHLGVGLLNLGVFVDVLSRAPRGRRAVALTFDDGPHPTHTRAVLQALDQAGAKATFFVVGRKVEENADVLREIVHAGHEVGLHSYEHDWYLTLRYEPHIVDDLKKNQDVVERVTGRRPTIFRPPVGLTSPRIRVAVKRLGLTVVGWSARAFDGAGRPDPARILSRILPDLDDGAIVLLHDAAERGDARPTSLEALPALLEELRARGLAAVTVSELLGAHAPSSSRLSPSPTP
jgi:peptidoglycan/xylan/chitin deacetylase (PgdA/CDA1 family)